MDGKSVFGYKPRFFNLNLEKTYIISIMRSFKEITNMASIKLLSIESTFSRLRTIPVIRLHYLASSIHYQQLFPNTRPFRSNADP